MSDLASIGGVVGGAIGILTTLAYVYRRKADNEAKRLEIDAKHAQAVLDRLATLEASEMMTDKKIDDLTVRATTAEMSRERLEWELQRARRDTEELRGDLTRATSRVTQLERDLTESRHERDRERARAEALAVELGELKRQLATGTPIVTPLRPPAPKAR
jgi:chromosome segregation ATPase